ncbi:MAG: Beta-galactosidase [Paenibacillus sp.]|nr:Beta-galactosidase [Paenibacillus sp.]
MMTDGIVWTYWGHEPRHHYRRLGGDTGSIFKNGEWIEEWYERLHSEDAIRQAAELNINLIYTHFFKGFGLAAEREEMEKTRGLVRSARRYGIRVLGYCQLNSLYYETLLDEAEDLEDWAGRNADGSIACWGGAYYRWSPCFNSEAFKRYMKKVIEYGLRDIELDGFHFDNSYNKPCYCGRCQHAFRSYVADRVGDPERMLGLRHVRHIRIPEFAATAEAIHDPLYAQWLHYRRRLTSSVHDELFGYAKRLSGQLAWVAHNPAFPRHYGHVNRIGYEPARSSAAVDIVFAENDGFIEKTGHGAKTQIEAYKYGQLFGYQVFNSSWLKDSQGKIRVPATTEEICLYEAEALAFGGLCGSPWLMRPLKDGSRWVADQDSHAGTLGSIFAYFSRHSGLYTHVRRTNSVKVLYHPDNVMLSIKQGYLSLLAAVQSLVQHGTPFSLCMLDDMREVGDDDLIVLPGVDYISDADVAAVRALSDQGHPLVVIGSFAAYNECGVEREPGSPVLEERDSIVRLPCRFDAAKYDPRKHFSAMSADISEFDQRFAEIVKAKTPGTRISFSKPGLLCETALDADGRYLVHLINPDNTRSIDTLTVSLTFPSDKVLPPYAHGELYSFEHAELEGFEWTDNRLEIVVRSLKTFCTLKLFESSDKGPTAIGAQG